jgi:general L-amino acid transport system permease protein
MVYKKVEEKPAPINQRGIIRWLRENLFSTPFDAALTLLGFYLLYLIIPPFLQWAVFDADFVGNSRADCGGDGACWLFIKAKIDMYLYGFYPLDLHWRPNLMYALFGVLVLSFIFIKNNIVKIALFLIYLFISWVLVYGGMFGLEVVETTKWGGLMLTIIVAGVGIIASFPIGIIMAFGRQSKLPIIKSVTITYIEFIRGVPLITILFMSSVILPLFFPEGVTFDKLLRALIGITLFQAAYIAEIIRGGLQSIPKGQYEAADAIGLSYWQKMLLVILPQALKVAIPNLVGSFIALFQDTTLVLIIGLFDLLAMVQLTSTDVHWLGFETEGYVFVTILFWAFSYAMSRYSRYLEKRFDTDLK